LVQSKFHNNIQHVSFICKKPTPKTSREFIHKYEPIPSQDIDHLFEEILEGVDPLQTNIISNLQQEHEKILNKSNIQEKIVMDRLLENSPKSLTEIAKNSDFLLNIE
jgi:Zn-dependent M32 family carboxypeptidase